ncbi:MAG: NUDIX domain-containing protein [Candidatus Micrarchaeota archaeon]
MNTYPEVAVGAFILNDDGELLLTKSHKFNNKWTIPGGHIEYGETIEQALKREALEETGLKIKILSFIQVEECVKNKEFHDENKHLIFIDYLCKAENNEVKLLESELQKFVWVKPEKALEMNLAIAIKPGIEKIMKLKVS